MLFAPRASLVARHAACMPQSFCTKKIPGQTVPKKVSQQTPKTSQPHLAKHALGHRILNVLISFLQEESGAVGTRGGSPLRRAGYGSHLIASAGFWVKEVFFARSAFLVEDVFAAARIHSRPDTRGAQRSISLTRLAASQLDALGSPGRFDNLQKKNRSARPNIAAYHIRRFPTDEVMRTEDSLPVFHCHK